MNKQAPPLSIPFDNSYAALPEGFYTRLSPTPVSKPELIAFNEDLAEVLRISSIGDDTNLAEIFSGNKTVEGSEPLAQLYSGHQFGQYNPQLGDGRARCYLPFFSLAYSQL